MINLLILVAVVALVCWLLLQLGIPEPFRKIIIFLGVAVCVFAILQVMFGIDLLGRMHSLGAR